MKLGIGPHEGRELELLLCGEKPVARFTLDGLDPEYEAQFDAAIERGEILGFKFPSDRDVTLDRCYYCLPGETWRVKLMELVHELTINGKLDAFSSEELHRMDGALLGYSRTDIDAFIRHIRALRRRRQNSPPL